MEILSINNGQSPVKSGKINKKPVFKGAIELQSKLPIDYNKLGNSYLDKVTSYIFRKLAMSGSKIEVESVADSGTNRIIMKFSKDLDAKAEELTNAVNEIDSEKVVATFIA